MNKSTALAEAIEIVKEYGSSGYSDLHPDVLLERLYRKLVDLFEDSQIQNGVLSE